MQLACLGTVWRRLKKPNDSNRAGSEAPIKFGRVRAWKRTRPKLYMALRGWRSGDAIELGALRETASDPIPFPPSMPATARQAKPFEPSNRGWLSKGLKGCTR
jgi:hypothetical protein